MINIYFDGSARPSPVGKSRTCFVVIFEDGTFHCQQDSWPASGSLEAEWKAFFESLKYCTDNNLDSIHFYGDCLDVIEGVWGIPRKRMNFIEEFELMPKPEYFEIDHVRRDINLAGIVLDDGSQSKHFKTKLKMLEGVECQIFQKTA